MGVTADYFGFSNKIKADNVEFIKSAQTYVSHFPFYPLL